jgi:hypothetical protein
MRTIKTIDLWQVGFLDTETVLRGAVADGFKMNEIFENNIPYYGIDILKNISATYNNPHYTDFSNGVLFKNKDGVPTRLALFKKDKDFEGRVRGVLGEKLILGGVSYNEIGQKNGISVVDAGCKGGREVQSDFEGCSADRPKLLGDFVSGNLIEGQHGAASLNKLKLTRAPLNLKGCLGEYDLDIQSSKQIELDFKSERWIVGIQDNGSISEAHIAREIYMAKKNNPNCEIEY